jgi:hypothetical protein
MTAKTGTTPESLIVAYGKQRSVLGHYATSRKVPGLIPDEITGFFNWPGVDSASNRNEYKESSWGKGRPAREADNLTAICETIV